MLLRYYGMYLVADGRSNTRANNVNLQGRRQEGRDAKDKVSNRRLTSRVESSQVKPCRWQQLLKGGENKGVKHRILN